MEPNVTFSIPDYIVFAVMLLISAGIGIYYACAGGKQKTTNEFLLGNRQMHYFPVAMSLVASFISAIAILGTPSEVYRYGFQYCAVVLSYLVIMPVAMYCYIPVFYELGLTSAFEYLSIRFGPIVRSFAALLFCIHMTVYMAIVLYAPALALSAVTGLHLWGSVIAVGVVCTFYTTLGGMKAVLWTDTVQIGFMVAGIIVVITKGSIDLGGWGEVWRIASNGSRIEFWNMDPSPLTRHTFFTQVIGGVFVWGAVYCVNQAQVQRALSCKSLKHMQIAYWINMFGLAAFIILSGMVGLVAYAKYHACDPLMSGRMTSPDQLFPLYVMDTLYEARGLPGLFVSCVFSGALSTMSSGLNSLSAVILVDFVKPYCSRAEISELKSTIISKSIAVVFGIVCIGLTVVVSEMGMILQASYALFGVIGAPALGVFTLGMFFPRANSIGGLVGMVSGFAVSAWLAVGKFITKPYVPKLPVSIDGCANSTIVQNITTTLSILQTTTDTTTAALPSQPKTEPFVLYQISYMWSGLIGTVLTIVIGLLVSIIVGCFAKTEPVERKLLTGCVRGLCKPCTKDSNDDEDDVMEYDLPDRPMMRTRSIDETAWASAPESTI